MATKKKPKLTPPDRTQCQAEVPNGHSFMTLGGRPERVRCTNRPSTLVEETKPGSDGQKGSMTLCRACLKVFKTQMGEEGYKFTPFKPPREKREPSSRGTRIDGSTRFGE